MLLASRLSVTANKLKLSFLPENRRKLKRLTPALWTALSPHSVAYMYFTDYPQGLPLIISQICFNGGKTHKKPSCSTYRIITMKKAAIFFSPTSCPSLFFSFLPHFFIGHLPNYCLCNGRLVNTVEYLSVLSVCHQHEHSIVHSENGEGYTIVRRLVCEVVRRVLHRVGVSAQSTEWGSVFSTLP